MYISSFLSHLYEAAAHDDVTFEQAALSAKDAGIEAVDVSMDEFRRDPELGVKLDALGLRTASLHGHVDLASAHDSAGAEALVDAASALRCDKILIVSGRAESVADKRRAADSIAAGLGALCVYAAPKGVTVTVENFSGTLTPYSAADELTYLLDSVPALRYTLDTGNFRCVCEDAVWAAKLLMPRLVHVHVKDWCYAPAVPAESFTASDGKPLYGAAVGDGIAPLPEIFEVLKKNGYDGALTVELHGVDDAMTALRRSCAWIKSHIA